MNRSGNKANGPKPNGRKLKAQITIEFEARAFRSNAGEKIINPMHALFIFHNIPLINVRGRMSRTRRKKEHTRAGEEETETEDIYDDKQREEMLKEDEISAAEDAFMQGRETEPKKEKRPTHKDTVSVELAEKEYEED